MQEYLDVHHKNSQSSSSTGFFTTHKTRLCFQNEAQNIVISPPIETDRFQNLQKAQGDNSVLVPETEKNENIRQDMFKTSIVHGSKAHKVSFKDQIHKQKLVTVYYYTKQPEVTDDDDCCPCLIF